MPEGHRIRLATASDLPQVLAVQHAAFSRIARAFGIPTDHMPPLTETLPDLERLVASGTRFLVATDAAGRIVGTVRGTPHKENVDVARLAVADGSEGLGIGTALMEALEDAFPEAGRFELFTGAGHTAAIGIYERLGYRIFQRRTVDGGHELVWLEKRRPAR